MDYVYKGILYCIPLKLFRITFRDSLKIYLKMNAYSFFKKKRGKEEGWKKAGREIREQERKEIKYMYMVSNSGGKLIVIGISFIL